jgi:hypothetical protein
VKAARIWVGRKLITFLLLCKLSPVSIFKTDPCEKKQQLFLLLHFTEYWMIYRGPGFLAVVWLGSLPNPPPPLPSVSATGDTRSLRKREYLPTGEGGGGVGRGAESWDSKKTRSLFKSFNTLCYTWPLMPFSPAALFFLGKVKAERGEGGARWLVSGVDQSQKLGARQAPHDVRHRDACRWIIVCKYRKLTTV